MHLPSLQFASLPARLELARVQRRVAHRPKQPAGQHRFGSKRRAKEEILARYASFLYMGNGQYGFSTASQYYFGRPLASLTAEDADKAALLAGTNPEIEAAQAAQQRHTRSGEKPALHDAPLQP